MKDEQRDKTGVRCLGHGITNITNEKNKTLRNSGDLVKSFCLGSSVW